MLLHLTNILRLQNGTECLAAFVREGGEAFLSWGGDADRTMGMLLDAAARCADYVHLKLQDLLGFLQSTVSFCILLLSEFCSVSFPLLA